MSSILDAVKKDPQRIGGAGLGSVPENFGSEPGPGAPKPRRRLGALIVIAVGIALGGLGSRLLQESPPEMPDVSATEVVARSSDRSAGSQAADAHVIEATPEVDANPEAEAVPLPAPAQQQAKAKPPPQDSSPGPLEKGPVAAVAGVETSDEEAPGVRVPAEEPPVAAVAVAVAPVAVAPDKVASDEVASIDDGPAQDGAAKVGASVDPSDPQRPEPLAAPGVVPANEDTAVQAKTAPVAAPTSIAASAPDDALAIRLEAEAQADTGGLGGAGVEATPPASPTSVNAAAVPGSGPTPAEMETIVREMGLGEPKPATPMGPAAGLQPPPPAKPPSIMEMSPDKVVGLQKLRALQLKRQALRKPMLPEPPEGAPEVSLMFVMWAKRAEERLASVRVNADGPTMVVREGGNVAGVEVFQIRPDGIDVIWHDSRFRVGMTRF